ncbi:MAG: helix-turn-helix domain-containing protein [Candidatus Ranarchaeia archaeon]
MQIKRAYKYELKPNKHQKTHLTQHAGTARFTYNWGLEQRIKQYQEKIGNERYTDAIKQHKELNRLKKTQFPWMYQVSKCAPKKLSETSNEPSKTSMMVSKVNDPQ